MVTANSLEISSIALKMLVTLEKSQNFTYYDGIMLDAFAILQYNAQNYAGIIGSSLISRVLIASAYSLKLQDFETPFLDSTIDCRVYTIYGSTNIMGSV